jgi:hypothetical protein
VRPDLSAQVLPACDLQAVMPERLQLPADLRQAHVLPRAELCSQVCTRSGVVRRSLCSRSGSRDLRRSVCSGSGDVCCSLCSQVRSGSGDMRRSVRSQVRSGPGDLCRSVCSRSGDVRRSVCSRSGSGVLRRSVRSGSGQVLRYGLPDQVLQCRSLRSGALDL